jgi:hypothetical protein
MRAAYELLERPHNALQVKAHMRHVMVRSLSDQAPAMQPDLLGGAGMGAHFHCTMIFPVILGCTEQ